MGRRQPVPAVKWMCSCNFVLSGDQCERSRARERRCYRGGRMQLEVDLHRLAALGLRFVL